MHITAFEGGGVYSPPIREASNMHAQSIALPRVSIQQSKVDTSASPPALLQHLLSIIQANNVKFLGPRTQAMPKGGRPR